MKILSYKEVHKLTQSFIDIVNILEPKHDTSGYQETLDAGCANHGHMLALSTKVVDLIKHP